MTLYEIVRKFENLALAAPNVRTAADGNVYDAMNDNPKLKYGVFFVSQDTHQEFEQMDRYGLTLFYIDRLDDTLEDNRLQIQSIGKEILSTVIRDFCEEYDVDLPTMNYIPFTEKFKDLTAGIYVQITIEVYKDDCYDDFSEVKSVYQTKVVDIYHNGEYSIQPDKDYTALKEVIVNVNVECSGCTPEQLEEAYQSGRTDQKNLLSTTAFTENGSYTSENGWSGITVDVPSTGSTINNQDKSVSLTTTGSTTITYDSGYTGLGTVTVTPNNNQWEFLDIHRKDLQFAPEHEGKILYGRFHTYPQSGYSGIGHQITTVEIDYTDLYNLGYTSGETHQKSLLTTTAFTENGTYSITDGWSAVTVNVPTEIAYHNLKINFSQSERVSGLTNNAVVYLENASGTTGYTYTGSVISVNLYPGMEYKVTYGDVINYDSPSSTTINTIWSGSTTLYPVYAYHNQPVLDVQPDSNNLHYNAQTLSLSVTSDTSWTITDYPEWAVPSVTAGTGNKTVVVTLSENTGAERRTYIIFKTNDETVEKSVYIRQGVNGHNYENDYMTFTALNTGYINWSFQMCNGCTEPLTQPKVIQYRKNGGSWTSITASTSGTHIPVVSGDVVEFKGTNTSYHSSTHLEYSNFSGTTCRFNLSGNLDSMFYGDNFINSGDALYASANYLFRNCTTLIDASNFVLPKTKLYVSTYSYMFINCSGMTKAPKILPATKLYSDCYYSMFNGCSSLVVAPELPATYLYDACYCFMFAHCSSLNTVKCLATNISARNCTYQWLNEVANSGTFTTPSTTSWTTGISGIPSGWTRIDA